MHRFVRPLVNNKLNNNALMIELIYRYLNKIFQAGSASFVIDCNWNYGKCILISVSHVSIRDSNFNYSIVSNLNRLNSKRASSTCSHTYTWSTGIFCDRWFALKKNHIALHDHRVCLGVYARLGNPAWRLRRYLDRRSKRDRSKVKGIKYTFEIIPASHAVVKVDLDPELAA